MIDRVEDIDQIFSMFHDFEVIGLKEDKDALFMEIILPWSEMWGIEEYKMTFCFKGLTDFKCTYWRNSSSPVGISKDHRLSCKEYITSDLSEIVKLELDIQSHDFRNKWFTLHCMTPDYMGNQLGKVEFARLELDPVDYVIFDDRMKEMSLSTMKEWGNKWWREINEMWNNED